MMDRERVTAILAALGEALDRPATLCLIGSTPAILLGQDARQTQDIDIWRPASDYDAGALAAACRETGLLFDPKNEIEPDAIYLQVVRPGIVSLPSELALETIARFGALTVAMPEPVLIAAAKLTRASERDIEDVVWWVRHRNLTAAELEEAIARLPRAIDRETARENLIVVRVVAGGKT